MNFARINHILVPQTKDERDKWRKSRFAFLMKGMLALWYSLSNEGRFLFVFWLISGAVSLNVNVSQYYILWSMISGLLGVSLLVRGRFSLDDVKLSVCAPKRTAVGEQICFSIELRNRGKVDCRSLRVEGPFLPWDGRYVGDEPRIPMLERGGTLKEEMRIRFVARGEHHLDVFRVHALVPFGLAVGPSETSSGVRFLVVPRIADVRSLSIPRGRCYQKGGVALASTIGESRELIGIRPYRPGDPIRDIHAMGWARLGEPVVREYSQEYFSRIGVVLDTDGSQVREEQFEAAISLVAGVVAFLSRGETLVDLFIAGDDTQPLTVGRSLGFLDQALDLLAMVKPGPSFTSHSLEERLVPYFPRLSSLVLVFVDWDERREAFVRSMESIGAPLRILIVGGTRLLERTLSDFSISILTPKEITNGGELFL